MKILNWDSISSKDRWEILRTLLSKDLVTDYMWSKQKKKNKKLHSISTFNMIENAPDEEISLLGNIMDSL